MHYCFYFETDDHHRNALDLKCIHRLDHLHVQALPRSPNVRTPPDQA